jgi:hypothetical protein
LKYAEVSDGVGFLLDLVPAVNEVDEIKTEIMLSGVDFSKAGKTVAITNKEDTYDWLTSNPLGFGDWFLEISNRHLTTAMKEKQYRNMPYDIRMVFASAEKIPTYYYRSNLQRAVQFIKRHRDIYYDRSNLRNEKPSSILISALVADSVKDKYFLSISDIVNTFIYGYKSKNISIMRDDKILNPVDLRENLIKKYSDEKIIKMDKWLDDLKNFMHIEDKKMFRQAIHNDINTRVFLDAFEETKIVAPTKPWKR